MQNKGRGEEHWQELNLEPLAWTSNSGEENNSLDKKKQKKNKTKMFTSVASGLHI